MPKRQSQVADTQPGVNLPVEGKALWATSDVFSAWHKAARGFIHRHYQIGMHAHEFIEVNVVLRGGGQHHMGGRRMPITRGDVWVIPPQVAHGYERRRTLDVYHLLLHPGFIQAHLAELRMLPGFLMLFTVEPYFREESEGRHNLRLTLKALAQLRTLLALIQQESAGPEDEPFGVVETLSLALIARLCRHYSEQHPAAINGRMGHAPVRSLRAVIDLVAARYAEKLMLGDLAHASRMPGNYFCRIFRRVTGLTPMDYVTQYRLGVARRLLSRSDLSITDIAQQTGFYDAAHFSRQFHRAFGLPPSRWRG